MGGLREWPALYNRHPSKSPQQGGGQTDHRVVCRWRHQVQRKHKSRNWADVVGSSSPTHWHHRILQSFHSIRPSRSLLRPSPFGTTMDACGVSAAVSARLSENCRLRKSRMMRVSGAQTYACVDMQDLHATTRTRPTFGAWPACGLQYIARHHPR